MVQALIIGRSDTHYYSVVFALMYVYQLYTKSQSHFQLSQYLYAMTHIILICKHVSIMVTVNYYTLPLSPDITSIALLKGPVPLTLTAAIFTEYLLCGTSSLFSDAVKL